MKYLENHKKIMLIITEACNLNCTYCYEKNKGPSTMDFATAKKILDDSYKNMSGYESMVIELHGGEPFLNFKLMREIDEYVMNEYNQYPVLFRCITNGTLVHGEIQEWLKERKDRYEVMLSIDGNKTAHDLNRMFADGRGSFDEIDVDFFTETWEKCPVSMTINSAVLPYMAEGTIWLEEKGFYCCNAFEWAVDWNLEKDVPILKRELDKLIKYYRDKYEYDNVCLLMRYRFRLFFKPITEDFRYCVEIDDAIECYDTQGRFAPCHGFTEFTVNSKEIAEKYKNMTICDFVHSDENICKGCKLVRLCRTCFAANHMLSGNMQIQSEELCVLNCYCVKAGLEVERNKIKSKYGNNNEAKECFERLKIIDDYASDIISARG